MSANHRYLVDQRGTPFLMVGDSPQDMIGKLSLSDADLFLTNREAAGFNAVWIHVVCNSALFCPANGSTYDGIPPFTVQGDLSTPNPAYFNKVDQVLRLAATHGMVVLLDPLETAGWLPVFRSNGAAKCYNYGAYLGNRYKNFPNIIWMSGNDFQNWQNTPDDQLVVSLAQGIKNNDPNHIHTVELNYLVSGSLDDNNWRPHVSLDAAYTYYPTYDRVLFEYNRANMPVFMVEANYEFDRNTRDTGSPPVLRRQEYWTLLSGATGQLYGNHYTWQFANGWKTNIDTPGSAQMAHAAKLLQNKQWYNLVPDQNHQVVTGGLGTYSSSATIAGNDYLTAASTPDGSLAIAYMPTRRTVTVDMTKFSGNVQASWYDPTTGAYAVIAGSPFANTGSRQFTPSGNNSAGDGDWVLVMHTTGAPAPTSTPPSTPTATATATPVPPTPTPNKTHTPTPTRTSTPTRTPTPTPHRR
jgi:hypothetical protein